MFDKKKKYILDGGSGQTLLEKGLKQVYQLLRKFID